MTFIIVSYREEYEQRCGRGCNCLHGSNSSDFAVHAAESEEDAANWIVSRLIEDEHASFTNLVFDRWEHFVAFGSHHYVPSAEKGAASVHVRAAPVDYDRDDIGEQQAEENRVDALGVRLDGLVKARFEKLLAEKKAKKADEERKKTEQEQAAKEAQDRATLSRLKATYEGKG